MAAYDVIGNVVVVKFRRGASHNEKKKFARKLLKENKAVRTILEKTGKFSGRLRTQKTSYLAGEKTKEVLYKENDCLFRLNVDSCYFSPRLSTERLNVASAVKRGERVLVMFSGIGVYGIVIGKHSKVSEVVCVEIGRECNKYAKENVKRNKLVDKVKVVGGGVRRKIGRGREVKGPFARIVMARPNLADSFLDVAFSVIKKSGVIHFYCFYNDEDRKQIKEDVEIEAKSARKKVRILRIKKAGEVGKGKFRFRADIKIN
jgi:tRNA (guanine37-N1)-methyltransferase